MFYVAYPANAHLAWLGNAHALMCVYVCMCSVMLYVQFSQQACISL